MTINKEDPWLINFNLPLTANWVGWIATLSLEYTILAPSSLLDDELCWKKQSQSASHRSLISQILIIVNRISGSPSSLLVAQTLTTMKTHQQIPQQHPLGQYFNGMKLMQLSFSADCRNSSADTENSGVVVAGKDTPTKQ